MGSHVHTGSEPLARGAQVVLERVGREAILHDRSTGRVHVLNGSAARVWELCDGARGVEEVTATFAAHYGLAPAEVAGDVARVVEHLRAARLLG
jgi:PqqD family protein of HPr-rel-A system